MALAAPDWLSLPVDLLALTFGCLPLRPRLIVVSLVCRRWREAVLRSVISVETYVLSVPVTRSRPLVRFAERISCALPASLRSLSYANFVAFEKKPTCGCRFLRGLTGLTRLKLRVQAGPGTCNERGCDEWLGLILSSAASLTDVSLEISKAATTPATLQALTAVRMPHLRSLHLGTEGNSADLDPLLSAHVTQLVQFNVLIDEKAAAGQHLLRPSAAPLPQCRSLHLELGCPLACLAHLKTTFPSLASLSLDVRLGDSAGDFPESDFPFSALTSLHIYADPALPVSLDWLSRCTALRTISCFASDRWPQRLPALPGLRNIYKRQASERHLRHLQCTRIERLTADSSVIGPLLEQGWTFPCLRKLHIFPDANEDLKAVQRVADLAPLRAVHLQFNLGSEPEARALCTQLVEVLSHLSSRGVEEVYLQLAYLLCDEIPALAEDLRKLSVPWMRVHVHSYVDYPSFD